MRISCYRGGKEPRHERIRRQALEEFIDSLVKQGRYASATEVMREGLRLVEEREEKLKALRETIRAAIAEGGAHSDEEVAAYLAQKSAELKARGY
jgi:antitoxin ParD1/3/4